VDLLPFPFNEVFAEEESVYYESEEKSKNYMVSERLRMNSIVIRNNILFP